MSVFSEFLTRFCTDAPQISHNKIVSKVSFSIIHLVRTIYELTSSIIQTYYTRTTLFCLICESCSRSKTGEFFLQKQCPVCAAFADAHASFLEWLLTGRSLFSWFCAFFLLFVTFVQPLITDSFKFKPAIQEGR